MNLLSLGLMLLFVSCAGNPLKSSNKKGFGPLSFSAPYMNYATYHGFVSPGASADGKYKGKKAYYLYFWVPAVIDEVGVSMVSPAKDMPSKDGFKNSIFDKAFAKDNKSFFDTFIALEKLAIIDSKKIKNGGRVLQELTSNDDSGELKANPSGSKYNSLLRHQSVVSNPLKALSRGVYRVSFTSFRGQVKGSYKAQIGTNIPGVKISDSLEGLHKLVNQ